MAGFYGEHLLCERDGGRHVVGVPAMGCAFWQQEPGTPLSVMAASCT